MSFSEDVLKLRKRVQEAVGKGIVANDGKEIFEATLVQIMNDAEKNRQNCLTQADNLRRQAATFEGQSGAFASVSSIVNNVLNGFIALADREEAERARQEAEKAEMAGDGPVDAEPSSESMPEEVPAEKKKATKKK